MLTTSILIIGSGPVGLWLAYELRRNSDLDVLVIDIISSKEKRNKYSKALSISAGALETFASRSVQSHFLEAGKPMHRTHFAGALIDLNESVLGAQYSHNLMITQNATEKILLDLCESVGVRFLWGTKLSALSQNEAVVSVTAERETEDGISEEEVIKIRAGWVVGCDGTHSSTREHAGISFEGTASTMSCDLADLQLSQGPSGILKSSTGSSIVPLGDGVHYRCASAMVPLHQRPVTSRAPTLEQIKHSLQETFGSDFGAHSPLWLTSTGNACRVASSFRVGRVMLAGDAGHQIFPAGGQGMNLGFQDATSLAWRLVMVAGSNSLGSDVRERLLQSYSRERRSAAKAVCENVQAQMAMLAAATPPERALRAVFKEALQNPDLNALWARRLTGFGDPADGYAYLTLRPESGSLPMDSLVGTRVTSQICGSSMGELFEATTSEKFVLICLVEEKSINAVLESWQDKVEMISMTAEDKRPMTNIAALLVRPDMRVAWVARSELPIATYMKSLVAVLEYWFGDQ